MDTLDMLAIALSREVREESLRRAQWIASLQNVEKLVCTVIRMRCPYWQLDLEQVGARGATLRSKDGWGQLAIQILHPPESGPIGVELTARTEDGEVLASVLSTAEGCAYGHEALIGAVKRCNTFVPGAVLSPTHVSDWLRAFVSCCRPHRTR